MASLETNLKKIQLKIQLQARKKSIAEKAWSVAQIYGKRHETYDSVSIDYQSRNSLLSIHTRVEDDPYYSYIAQEDLRIKYNHGTVFGMHNDSIELYIPGLEWERQLEQLYKRARKKVKK